jgi:hypothetical protein
LSLEQSWGIGIITMSLSLVPPLQPRAATIKARNSSKNNVAPTRSAHREKDANDGTHVIRVTVLGLAGITVDRSKCRYSSKDAHLPASPSKMRAVVAFSRNSVIRGTTALSKPLTRSPTDDVVVATTDTEEAEISSVAKSAPVEVVASTQSEEQEISPVDDSEKEDTAAVDENSATHEITSTNPSPQLRRHLAVWASEDLSIGSTVTFEAALHRYDSAGDKSTAASSAFAPKSFDLTIGLTESKSSDQTAVALPLGVATLTVTGDESTNGESVMVDLPVWTLLQTRPLDNADGSDGYPLITLVPASESMKDGIPLKKKRAGLQRLFSKKDKNGILPFPSSAERAAFSSAYSMDSAGDAILRVSVEVYEKDSVLDAAAEAQKNRRKKLSNRPGSPVVRKEQEIDSYDDSTYNSDEDTELTDRTDETGCNDEDTDYSSSLATGDDESITLQTAEDETVTLITTEGETITLITTEDETITVDDSRVTNEDNKRVFFSWVNRPKHDRGGSRGRVGRKSGRRTNRGSTPFRVPGCERSVSRDSREDMTHVTADFFGDSYQIPLCRGIAKKDDDDDDDDDSTTTYSDQNTAAGSTMIVDIMNHAFCQNDVKNQYVDDANVTKTFSTLSENSGLMDRNSSLPKQVFITNEEMSGEAKIPEGPDEPGEVDDIMRIVRSKKKSKSPKPRDLLKAQDKMQENKYSATEVSPKGVDGFVEAEETTQPKSRIMQNISDILQCNYTGAFHGPRYEPFEPGIPPVVIHSDTDAVSVGDLTANTHERNIEGVSDTYLLDRARKMLNEGHEGKEKETHKLTPCPIPSCGRDGLCSPLARRDTTSSPIRLDTKETASIIQNESQHPRESPVVMSAPETDDGCTAFSPIEVEKVASEERGTPFSRVRSPSAERGDTETIYSKSLPIYSSMNGDESESIIDAFAESKSDDRQMFNPITGQEVDQAFI